MKKKYNNDLAAVGIIGLVVIFLVVLVVPLIIVGIISLVIGFLGFIGLCFLCAAAYLLYKNKGNVTISKTSPFLFCVILGISLIILSSVGLEIAQLDFSNVPGLSELHMMINP